MPPTRCGVWRIFSSAIPTRSSPAASGPSDFVRLPQPMNARRKLVSLAVLSGIALAGIAGCSFIPEAQSDPTKYYVLSSSASAMTPQSDAPVVHLRDVELASYL